MNKRKKRSITLIEIMIVILLIGLIGGALAYNMRGSMDQGKAFKTKQNIARIEEAIMLKYAQEDIDLDAISKDKTQVLAILKATPFLKNPDKLMKDGWGKELTFKFEDSEIKATSTKLDEWEAKHGKM